jgi:hypothetical protein
VLVISFTSKPREGSFDANDYPVGTTSTARRFVRACKTATTGYGGGGRSLSPDLSLPGLWKIERARRRLVYRRLASVANNVLSSRCALPSDGASWLLCWSDKTLRLICVWLLGKARVPSEASAAPVKVAIRDWAPVIGCATQLSLQTVAYSTESVPPNSPKRPVAPIDVRVFLRRAGVGYIRHRICVEMDRNALVGERVPDREPGVRLDGALVNPIGPDDVVIKGYNMMDLVQSGALQ